MPDYDALLGKFDREPAASAEDVRRANEELGLQLPLDYVAFLREGNGGVGLIGETYLVLWAVDELAEMNAGYEVNTNAPDVLLIGSNGGGEAFAFDKRTTPWAVVKIPFIGMDREYIIVLAPSFAAFLQHLAHE